MNILVINGSPKGINSNTYKLTTSFVEGIKEEKNDVNIEELIVNKLNIKSCLGCFSCWNKTPGKCVINDDMSLVIEKILWADITIWSFPLYYFNVPGKLKLLIDRLLPTVMPFMDTNAENGSHKSRFDMTNKRNILISTCGFWTTKGNYDSVISLFNHLFGNEYEKIFCSQGELFRVPELSKRTNEYLTYVKNAGKEYINNSISNKTRTKLNEILFSKEKFESMADASWGIEKETNQVLDESFIFTKQMASLYNTKSYSGKDIILEMNYIDIDKTYQIVLKKDSFEVLKDNFKDYTTKIETPFSLWKDIASGKITGEEALMKQLYKVKGDFNFMIKWDTYFGEEKIVEKKEKKSSTNMLIMLLPWIMFWVLIPIDNYYGAVINIFSCSLINLIFIKNKKTFFDIISSILIISLSLLVILFKNEIYLVPISYLLFGLMWLISCLNKIPLTAFYSMNDYNGEKAFNNPLFIKTNRILTFLWGILYVITSIYTYFLIKTDFSTFISIINSALPILMGIFTSWFQNWYPAKFAKGNK